MLAVPPFELKTSRFAISRYALLKFEYVDALGLTILASFFDPQLLRLLTLQSVVAHASDADAEPIGIIMIVWVENARFQDISSCKYSVSMPPPRSKYFCHRLALRRLTLRIIRHPERVSQCSRPTPGGRVHFLLDAG
jgi:hypothetical protein